MVTVVLLGLIYRVLLVCVRSLTFILFYPFRHCFLLSWLQ